MKFYTVTVYIQILYLVYRNDFILSNISIVVISFQICTPVKSVSSVLDHIYSLNILKRPNVVVKHEMSQLVNKSADEVNSEEEKSDKYNTVCLS